MLGSAGSNRNAIKRERLLNWLRFKQRSQDTTCQARNNHRSIRRRRGSFAVELLESRILMAIDVGISISDAEERLQQLAGLNPTHTYYVDGQSKGLVAHPSRFAIDLRFDGSTRSELESLGLTFVRKLNSEFSIYDFDDSGASTLNYNSWRDSSLIDKVAPVFVAKESSSEAVVLDELIVELADGIEAELFFAENEHFRAYRPLPGTSDQYVATIADGLGEAALEVASSFFGDTRIAWIEPNFYQDWQKLFIPNDPRFGNQWHLHNTGQGGGTIDADSDLPEAWDVIQGGSADYTIAIIDDGVVTNHPDLTVWVNPGEVAGDGIDNDGNGWVDDVHGWNFVSNNNQSGTTSSSDVHGTAVAGVAAAKGNNGIGVAGASYGSKVLSARIFEGSSVASDANIASALYYSAGRKANGNGTWKAADVLNNSWGGGASSTVINTALAWGTTSGRQGKGAPIFVASGNEFGAVSEPALQSLNIPGVFAVGAINNRGEKSNYSNFGASIDIVTPSNDTRSGYLAIDTTDRPGSAGYDPSDYTGTGSNGFGGTSSATPLASGIAALTMARADQLGVTLTPAQLRSYLRSNTDIVGSSAYSLTTGRNNNMGWGRLNAASAVSNLGNAEISVMSASAELFNSSSTINFGNAQLGTTVDVTLRIRNQGTANLVLSSLSVGSGPFTVQSSFGASTLALGAATTFTLRFQPTAEGIVNGTVTIGSNDANESLFTINLIGNGTTSGSGGGPSGALLTWDVNGQTAFGTQGLIASNVAAGVTNSLGLTRGSGVTTINTAASNAWGGNGWASSASAGVSDDKSVSFGFTVSAGNTASLSSLDLNYRRSNSGTGNGLWQYQINVGAWTDIGDLANAFSSTSSSGAAMPQLDLSGISNLQNLTAGTTVNLRVVPYGATSTGGTWYVFDMTGDDLIVSGSVQPASGANTAPTDIAISSSTIAENAGANSTIGILSSTDPNAGNTFTYSLVTGTGSTDNAAFAIVGNTLTANASFDFETKSSYSIRIRTTDQGGLFFEKAFTISVTNVNEASTVATSNGSSVYTGTGPVVVDADVFIADVDSTTLVGATISITSNFTSGQDELGFVDANGITGLYNGANGVLSLAGTATLANYQAALRSVTYNNSNGSPNTTARTVSFQVNDGGTINNLSNTSTKSVTVAVASSQPVAVTAVTATTTGFTVQFSRPIDPAQINLYDATTNSLGETDVTLVGAVYGAVRGSVVFSATNTSLTFVKTGMGILEADTYTLTLRSATTGFVDFGGNLLRDIGGANAGDYVATFTINAPLSNAVILSIPDFARGFSQTVNVPNTSTGLPIIISNANNIGGVDVTVNYDPALLTITGISTPIAGASAVINTSVPGVARIQVASPEAFAIVDGAATILNLAASVPSNAPYASKGIISFTKILVRNTNLDEVPSVADNAVHVAAFFADLNADQAYDSADSILVQRLGVRLNSGTTAFQTLDPYVIGDALGDLTFDSADTITVQRLGVNIPVPQVPNLPAGAGTNVVYGADPELSIGNVTATSASVGTHVFVPINLLVTEIGGTTLAGMDIAISFDPNQFQVNPGGVAIASSAQGGLIWYTDESGNSNPNLVDSAFTVSALNIDNVAGIICIQALSSDGTRILPYGTSGTLLQVRFTIKSTVISGRSEINLLANAGSASTRLRDNNLEALTLIPAPTNDSNDRIDGSITISELLATGMDPMVCESVNHLTDLAFGLLANSNFDSYPYLRNEPAAEKSLMVELRIMGHLETIRSKGMIVAQKKTIDFDSSSTCPRPIHKSRSVVLSQFDEPELDSIYQLLTFFFAAKNY